MANLYVFNPEHDISLARGIFSAMAPRHAVCFAQECAWIMAWIYGDGYVLCPEGLPPQWLSLSRQYGVGSIPITPAQVPHLTFDRVIPWGWDSVVAYQLGKMGVPSALLPTQVYLENLRELQHRSVSTLAAAYIYDALNHHPQLAPPAEVLSSLSQVQDFLSTHQHIVVKAPWSGSGQGVRMFQPPLTTHEQGWVNAQIKHQRCVVCNPYYDLVNDFAMEFLCHADSVSFEGYSLFSTHGGAYQGNQLMPDRDIETYLSSMIPLSLLSQVRSSLMEWIQQHVVGSYEGPLGVDMFVYKTNNDTFALNPMCEINFRHTMGMVAHRLLHRYPDLQGREYRVVFGQQAPSPHTLCLTPWQAPHTQYRCQIS